MKAPRVQLWVSDEDALSGDVSGIVNFTSGLTREQAIDVGGGALLMIPFFDPDPRPNYAIPEARRFIANLDAAIPHFPYYLNASPAIGHIRWYLASLVTIDPEAGTFAAEEMFEVAIRKVFAVSAFCETLGIESKEAATAVLMNLPPAMAKAHPALVTQIEISLRPFFERLRSRLKSDDQLDRWNRDVAEDVGALYELRRADYDTDVEYVDAIIRRMRPLATAQDVREFDESLEALMTRVGGGRIAVQNGPLVDLVRARYGAALAYVTAHVQMAAAAPRYLRSAAAIAAAIEVAFNDAWPRRQVEERAKAMGLEEQDWMPGMADDLGAARSIGARR